MRTTLGFIARSVFACALCAAPLSAGPAMAKVQQAPSSWVALDLPVGYEPSTLFSGFVNEALGASFVVVEMPGKAYEEIVLGMTPEALALKGILNARSAKLTRSDAYLYMQAEQDSAAGQFAKFFIVFRDAGITALITANIQKASLTQGQVKPDDIESILASARIAPTAAPAKDLFTLDYLGPFKPAGQFLGTTKSYTLEGQTKPDERAPGRPTLIIAPSLDRRVVTKPDDFAEILLANLSSITDLRVTERRAVTIAGLPGVELIATAKDRDTGGEVAVYQVVLVPPAGGYFRIVGQMPAQDRATLMPEFRRVAEGFKPLP